MFPLEEEQMQRNEESYSYKDIRADWEAYHCDVQSFSPKLTYFPPEKLKTSKKAQKRFWKQHQNKLYLQFLQMHQKDLLQPLSIKTKNKINVQMSFHIRSKDAKQCRSHHQKMLIKHRSISGIVVHLRSQLFAISQYQNLESSMNRLLQQAMYNQYNNMESNRIDFQFSNTFISLDACLE